VYNNLTLEESIENMYSELTDNGKCGYWEIGDTFGIIHLIHKLTMIN
jgi:hypothetical protein